MFIDSLNKIEKFRLKKSKIIILFLTFILKLILIVIYIKNFILKLFSLVKFLFGELKINFGLTEKCHSI